MRQSIDSALKDISKKYPELIIKELKSWDMSSREVMQVYKLAGRFIAGKLK